MSKNKAEQSLLDAFKRPAAATDKNAAGELIISAGQAEESGERSKPIDWALCKRLFMQYMWPYKARVLLVTVQALLIAACYAGAPVLAPYFLGWTIESPDEWATIAAQISEFTGVTVSGSAAAGVLIGAALIGCIALAYYLIMSWRIMTVNTLAEYVVHDMRSDIFRHVQRLDMSFFDRTRMGWILSRGTSDVNAVRGAVAQVIPRLVIHSFETLLFVTVLLWADLPLAIVVLLVGPPVWFASTWFRKRIGDAYRTVQFSMSRITANLAETIGGIRVTQSHAREDLNAELFHDLCVEHRTTNMRAARIHGAYIPLLDLSNQLVYAVILGFGGYRALEGHVGISELLLFLFVTGRFFNAIQVLADIYNTTLMAMAGAERIFKLLDTKPTIVDSETSKPLGASDAGASIVFNNVSFSYSDDTPVLRDVSFSCEPGTITALVGHTGSGKTTIVSLIGRLYAHQHGQLLIDGADIKNITLESLHDQLALVLQDNFLFTGTVMDNIRLGRPDATDEEVIDACKALDCYDVFEQLPNGLHTDVGERGDALSLGQRQLACFARAMVANPRIIMMDEATSAIDTHTEHRLQVALERLIQGRTGIIVAHRLSTIRRADQILVLDHGQLIERGTHQQLIERRGHYADLHEAFVKLSLG